MKPTIYDVAKNSGVSVGTVSKVLHNSGRISPATRLKVFQSIQALNYKPSLVASALKAKRTFSIGLLISDITNPFCNLFAKAVEDAAIRHNYNVLIGSTENRPLRHRKLLEMMEQKQVDGLVVSSSSAEGDDSWAEGLQFPVVMADRVSESGGVLYVASDNEAGGHLAVEYLLAQGHRRIGILLEDRHLSSSRSRLAGYRRAHLEYGLVVDESFVMEVGFGFEAGRQAMLRIRDTVLTNAPTAVFAANDLLAVGLIQQASELGYHLPADLSVVGYDDIPLAEMVSPQLTTIHQPIEEMGERAVALLMKMMQAADVYSAGASDLLRPSLVERRSVCAVPPRLDKTPENHV